MSCRCLPDFSDWVWWKVTFDDDSTIVVVPAPRDIGAITVAMGVLGIESFKHAKVVRFDDPEEGFVYSPVGLFP